MIHHRKLIDSFKYAAEGVWFAFSNNQNLQIHVAVAILVAAMSVVFRINGFEMGILGVIILLVIAAEMINTAIEEMVDLITNEHRREAKIAKDVSAGMVLVTATGSVIVGILIFLPHILKLLNR
jgi:diacylglycerol kinase (ATP)